MATPSVLLLRAPGTNCDRESAHAFELAGAKTRTVHVRELLAHPTLLHEHQILCFPGGFSYGDDISAGRVLGNQLRLGLADDCRKFKDAGKLVLGICNGFQILVKTGLLDIDDAAGPRATLAWNDSGHFEARWVDLQVEPGHCVFLRDMTRMQLPVAHAEGKFLVRDDATLNELATAGRLVMRYIDPRSSDGNVGYPACPNGAMGSVAGMCDTTGRVLGLMPHPERFVEPSQHPSWTRHDAPRVAHGRKIFENAVAYFN